MLAHHQLNSTLFSYGYSEKPWKKSVFPSGTEPIDTPITSLHAITLSYRRLERARSLSHRRGLGIILVSRGRFQIHHALTGHDNAK